jgi:hypothetical protein
VFQQRVGAAVPDAFATSRDNSNLACQIRHIVKLELVRAKVLGSAAKVLSDSILGRVSSCGQIQVGTGDGMTSARFNTLMVSMIGCPLSAVLLSGRVPLWRGEVAYLRVTTDFRAINPSWEMFACTGREAVMVAVRFCCLIVFSLRLRQRVDCMLFRPARRQVVSPLHFIAVRR